MCSHGYTRSTLDSNIDVFLILCYHITTLFTLPSLDIVFNFRTTFHKSGQVVYEWRTIALKYMKGWFLLDLLAAIPFDILYAFSVETVRSWEVGLAALRLHIKLVLFVAFVCHSTV